MAASKDLSSLTWILDKVKFSSVLVDSFLTKDILIDCIAEEHIESVFRGILQLNYWKRKLGKGLDKRTVLMACLGPSGLLKPDICQLYEIIEQIIGEEEFTSIYYSENNNIVGFNFQSAEVAIKVQQEVAIAGEALVCFINVNPTNFHDVRVLWAPAFCPIYLISQIFETYATDIELAFEKVRVKAGHSLPCNIAVGKILLKDGIKIGDLPHIVKLPNSDKKYVLIVSKDRPPLCLKCRRVGHMRRQCTFSFCLDCKGQHAKDTGCTGPSYAQAASKRVISGTDLENTDTIMNSDAAFKELRNKEESISFSNNNSECVESQSVIPSKARGEKDLVSDLGSLKARSGFLELTPVAMSTSLGDDKEWMQVRRSTGRKVKNNLPKVNSISINSIKPDYLVDNNPFSLLEDGLDWGDDIVNANGAQVMITNEVETKVEEAQNNAFQLVAAPLPNQGKLEKSLKRLRVNGQESDSKKTKEGNDSPESTDVGVLTRAAAKALLVSSSGVEYKVNEGTINDKACDNGPNVGNSDISRVDGIVNTTGEDDLSDEDGNNDTISSDEKDEDSDEDDYTIKFPTDVKCFDCGTVIKVLSQPTDNFPCPECPRQYAYDTTRRLIYRRTALQSNFIKKSAST